MMDLERIYPINKRTVVARVSDVEEAEQELATGFPAGYSDYVTGLGLGVYTDLALVWPPWYIAENIGRLREQLATTRILWHDAPGVEYPEHFVQDTIPMIGSLLEDRIVFLRQNPNRLFLLPHDTDRVLDAGSTLQDALDAMLRWRDLHDRRTCYLLTPDGEFRSTDMRTFAFLNELAQRRFYCLPRVDVDWVRRGLIHLAWTANDAVLCTKTSSIRDGEWLDLYIPACSSQIRWFDPNACEDDRASVEIIYDASADTWRVNRIITFLEQAGYTEEPPPEPRKKPELPHGTTIHSRLVWIQPEGEG